MLKNVVSVTISNEIARHKTYECSNSLSILEKSHADDPKIKSRAACKRKWENSHNCFAIKLNVSRVNL